MGFIEQIERLERLSKLIEKESTGTPHDLANHLSVSKRQLFYHLDLLRDLGAPISYSRKSETYYYLENAKVRISFTIEISKKRNTEKKSHTMNNPRFVIGILS